MDANPVRGEDRKFNTAGGRPTWYKKAVHLWLERYIFPICVAIVVSLAILNPLKLDWPQRVSLAITVTALAYFIGHTVRKPASTPTQPDQRITFLEQQVQNLQSQQQQLLTQEETREKERLRKQEVKKQLAVLLQEGQVIQNGIEYNSPAALHQKADWERRVQTYLASALDESYAARFRSPSHQVTAYPMGISRDMIVPWLQVTGRMAMLSDFISELRD